jgi:exonuclease III
MAKFLQLTLWNANGLTQHIEELKTFISIHNIDVMLISETRFTEKSYLKLPNYTVYHTNHPAGTARGATAIIMKHSIKHHQLNKYSQDFLQATSVSVEDSVGLITILAVYLPPKHSKARTIRRFLQ